MPVFHTKTIESILDPVAQQVCLFRIYFFLKGVFQKVFKICSNILYLYMYENYKHLFSQEN